MVLSLLLGSNLGLEAQLDVSLRMVKSEFVANEQVQAVLTLTNRAGRDIYLHSEGRSSWLDFTLKNRRGVPLSPARGVMFGAVNVPTGQSVSKTIAVSDYYRVSELGHYSGYASIRMPGTNPPVMFTSNRVQFDVIKARVLYTQRVGVAGSTTVREYRLMSFNSNNKNQLYVEVEDVRTGRSMSTYSVGEALLFRKPQATVDGSNAMHILFLSTPTVFSHVRVDPNGKFLGRAFYKRGSTGSPRLVTFANGDVKVAGGIHYDPKQEQVNRSKIKKLSDRPPFAFR